MKINPKHISVSIYSIDGETKALVQMKLPHIKIKIDPSGLMNKEMKDSLQNAMCDALAKWELDVQEPGE